VYELPVGLCRSVAAHPGYVIAALPLAGEAREVAIDGSTLNREQQIAYVASGSRGLDIVNVAQFQMPSVLGQLTCPLG